MKTKITKTKKGRYQVDYRDKAGTRHREVFSTRAEAEGYARPEVVLPKGMDPYTVRWLCVENPDVTFLLHPDDREAVEGAMGELGSWDVVG